MEVSCHLLSPLGQAQASKEHFCESPLPRAYLLVISNTVLQRLMYSGFLPPGNFSHLLRYSLFSPMDAFMFSQANVE